MEHGDDFEPSTLHAIGEVAGGAVDDQLTLTPASRRWERQSMTGAALQHGHGSPALGGDQALAIAQADALKAYRDLSAYRIQLALEDDGWHVDYELKDPRLKGGGPHYVINAFTGAIVSKRYEQ